MLEATEVETRSMFTRPDSKNHCQGQLGRKGWKACWKSSLVSASRVLEEPKQLHLLGRNALEFRSLDDTVVQLQFGDSR